MLSESINFKEKIVVSLSKCFNEINILNNFQLKDFIVIEYLDLDCIKMENDDQAILARLTRDIAKYFLEQRKKIIY